MYNNNNHNRNNENGLYMTDMGIGRVILDQKGAECRMAIGANPCSTI
jgi:hypothetical protein